MFLTQAVEAAVAEEGWKMVLLLRCSPIIPFALLNYFLSLTSISFWDYSWASALGIVPGALFVTYKPPTSACQAYTYVYVPWSQRHRFGMPGWLYESFRGMQGIIPGTLPMSELLKSKLLASISCSAVLLSVQGDE